jgi:predicted ArsR family transcriptional regulator
MSSELTPEQEKLVQKRLQKREQQTAMECWEIGETEKAILLRTMKEHFGEEVYKVIVESKAEELRAQYKKLAEEFGDNSIESYVKNIWEPLSSNGFELTIEKTDSGYRQNLTKCPIYDAAKRNGITEEAYYLCCANDPDMAEGFNPNIGFRRTKTLMLGHDCCNNELYYKIDSK